MAVCSNTAVCKNHSPEKPIFTASAHWADSVYKSRCPWRGVESWAIVHIFLNVLLLPITKVLGQRNWLKKDSFGKSDKRTLFSQFDILAQKWSKVAPQELAGEGSVAVAVRLLALVTFDRWHATCEMWHMTPDTWHMNFLFIFYWRYFPHTLRDSMYPVRGILG